MSPLSHNTGSLPWYLYYEGTVRNETAVGIFPRWHGALERSAQRDAAQGPETRIDGAVPRGGTSLCPSAKRPRERAAQGR